jgi:hypothetical protein
MPIYKEFKNASGSLKILKTAYNGADIVKKKIMNNKIKIFIVLIYLYIC